MTYTVLLRCKGSTRRKYKTVMLRALAAINLPREVDVLT